MKGDFSDIVIRAITASVAVPVCAVALLGMVASWPLPCDGAEWCKYDSGSAVVMLAFAGALVPAIAGAGLAAIGRTRLGAMLVAVAAVTVAGLMIV